jgi:hypothetical protein
MDPRVLGQQVVKVRGPGALRADDQEVRQGRS